MNDPLCFHRERLNQAQAEVYRLLDLCPEADERNEKLEKALDARDAASTALRKAKTLL